MLYAIREVIAVTVVLRSKATGAVINCPKIEISAACPVCGEKRGEPFGYNFWEDGTSHWCQQWKNPCGHIDLYADVLQEASLLTYHRIQPKLNKR